MPKFMNATKVITGVNTRWSYANVWDPKSINGGAPKYSVSLIIPKSDTTTVNKIKAAIQAAYDEGQSKLKGNGKSVPALSAIKTPLRDGDLERPDDEAYKNSYFINANSSTAPGIVDADRQPILERSEVYSGVYGRGMIDFMLVIDQTKVPVRQLHVPNIPDVFCVVADQSHIVGICHDHREILPIYRLQFFRGKHAHHLAPGSATI